MLGRRRALESGFGQNPDIDYFHGDMDYIRSYHEHMRAARPDVFALDDITWNDLDMDRVFRRINRGRTTSGEQALYRLLREPALDEAEWRKRRDMVSLMSQEEPRGRAEAILAGLGCVRRAGPCASFPARRGALGRLALCALLALLLPLSFLSLALLGENGVLVVLAVVIVNSFTHETMKKRLAGELDAVNYMVAMVRVTRRFRRLNDVRLNAFLAEAYDALGRLKHILRVGFAMPAAVDGSPIDLLLTVTLLDMIAFERLRRAFLCQQDDVLILHEALGRLDAAISIASFRETLPYWCEPDIRFEPDAPRRVEAEAIGHPLLSHPVPNDLTLAQPLLITGSNASGKSTYLRTAALCALLAQAVCTAPARSYRAPACRLFTSMTLSDDLIAGESYYMAEMRAIKRIMDAASGGQIVLCAVDEVLRGTNTVERVAASCEILLALERAGALCLAATHDVELCALLADRYVNMHFEERLEAGKMLFDYRVRPGGATTRNAIDLLALIGLEQSIVDAAHARAARYLKTGKWA